jgi:hypothetical protein
MVLPEGLGQFKKSTSSGLEPLRKLIVAIPILLEKLVYLPVS